MADEIIGRISVGDGATFTPSVSDEGVLSWENNKNLPNPDDVDLAQAVIDKGGLAPINSPAFTGTPTAPTPTASDDSTKIATTEFVHDNTDNKLPLAGGTLTGQLVINKSNPSTPNNAGIKLVGAAQNFVISASRTDVTKGTAPSTTKNWGIDFYGTDIDSYNKRIGILETSLLSNNTASTAIRAYSCGSNTSTTECYISVNIDGNGNGFTYAPTPANGNNSNEIATTAFCKNNYLALSGGIVSGTVKFSTDNALSRNTTDGEFIIYGGEANFNSPCIALRGQERTTDAGSLYIRVKNTSLSKDLIAKPDGTFTWGGQPIQTSSDKRLKQDFADVPADVLEAWGKVNWQQFKYKADVERKGENCRFHTGLVAQDVKEVGEENNVDLLKYGILCHDVIEATEDSEAVDLWTVRYEEALAMEVIYLRNEIKKLREEIKALRTE